MRYLCLLLVAFASTGCLPMEPEWLPDSSGLIYTKPGEKTELKHLDLENKRHRVVTTIPNCVTSPPGVSPKGDRFAVIETIKGGGGEQIKVHVIDLVGEKVHTSKAIEVTPRDGNSPAWNAVSWSPVDDKLLLWIDPPQVYDVETGKYSGLPEGYTPNVFFLFYRVSPFLPDGSGLVVQKQDGGGQELAIWTWDGKVKPIAVDPKATAFQEPQGENQRFPTPARWKDNILRIEMDKGYAVIDIARAKLDFEPSEQLEKLLVKKEKDNWAGTANFANGARLIVRRLKPGEPQEYAVELLPTDGDTKTIAKQVFSGYGVGTNFVSIFPSPDGKQMAIKYGRESGGNPRMMIVDATGKILKDVEL